MAVKINSKYLSYDKDEVQVLLDKVNDADAQPTAESDNMISSGAVATALSDFTPIEQLAEALAGKQDKMDEASEESVRGIVKYWSPDADNSSDDAPGE